MSHSAAGQHRTLHAALLTPSGRGAIAVIGIAGPRAAEILAALFQPACSTAGHGTEGMGRTADQPSRSRKLLKVGDVRFGYWLRSDGTREEVVLTRPRQDAFEVHCHGGPVICQAILDDLARVGCCVESWQEYCAVLGANSWEITIRDMLAQARTEFAASVIASQARGAFHDALASVIDRVRRGHVAEAERVLQELYERGKLARHLIQPWHVTLLGPPNAGKSSLCNALVGYERAIVWPEPGTTRDVVDAEFVVDGWVFRLHDTAGLRSTADPLEQEGVRRAAAMASASDLILLVSSPDTTALHDVAFPHGIPILRVINKVDLYHTAVSSSPSNFHGCSNTTISRNANLGIDAEDKIISCDDNRNEAFCSNILSSASVNSNTKTHSAYTDVNLKCAESGRQNQIGIEVGGMKDSTRTEPPASKMCDMKDDAHVTYGYAAPFDSKGGVLTSALYGTGIEELRQQILRMTVGPPVPADVPLPLTEDHRMRLFRAKQFLQERCVDPALVILEQLHNEVRPLWRFV